MIHGHEICWSFLFPLGVHEIPDSFLIKLFLLWEHEIYLSYLIKIFWVTGHGICMSFLIDLPGYEICDNFLIKLFPLCGLDMLSHSRMLNFPLGGNKSF